MLEKLCVGTQTVHVDGLGIRATTNRNKFLFFLSCGSQLKDMSSRLFLVSVFAISFFLVFYFKTAKEKCKQALNSKFPSAPFFFFFPLMYQTLTPFRSETIIVPAL